MMSIAALGVVILAGMTTGWCGWRKVATPQKPLTPLNTVVAPEKAPQSTREIAVESELMGKFEPATHPDFVAVAPDYSDDGKAYFLRKETYEAFKLMHEAAKKDGISLRIISATRNFERQKQIWEAKWTGGTLVGGKNLAKTIADPTARALKILTYSSMPSTSRHHWGTDFDLNNLEPAYFNTGQGKKIYDWLVKHAATYGFAQPYTAGRATGYNEEKWHWSYTPLAQGFTRAYAKSIQNSEITGFQGSETAVAIDMVSKYVLGVAENCR